MQAGELGARHGEQAERVVVAQVELGHEREFAEVAQRFQIIRVHTLGLAFAAIGFDVVVGVADRPLQAFDLQRGNLVAAGGFDGVEIAGHWFRDGMVVPLWLKA